MSQQKKKNSPAPRKGKIENRRSGEAGAEPRAAELSSETGSVDKIRDIIFGNQMRDYEKRFTHMEERLLQEIRDLRDETKNRLDTIQSYIQKEIDSLSDRLNTEQKMRMESLEKVANEFKAEAKAISENIKRLEDQQSKDSRSLREQLLEQSKSFSDEISKKHEESSTALDRSVQQLRTDTVERSALSELLMEMAVRMSDGLGEKLNIDTSDVK